VAGGGGHLAGRCEGAVDVEEREDARIPHRGSHRHPPARPATAAASATNEAAAIPAAAR
jgi:hypothetical protein